MIEDKRKTNSNSSKQNENLATETVNLIQDDKLKLNQVT